MTLLTIQDGGCQPGLTAASIASKASLATHPRTPLDATAARSKAAAGGVAIGQVEAKALEVMG